ncbi:hypothetical protein GCM10023314_11700 [Algibacter agarivorans]|uniref:RteC protein n=1 Tax=Algibacter agarivorans TaxID=1109741 RepID=A0ABP9GF23_9FLAO
MAKGILKTDYHTLQTYLIEIAEIPARLNRCDIVLKNELLEHIDIRIDSLLKTINERLLLDKDYSYPVEYLPNKQFEYWGERVSCVFNYYELLKLKGFIKQSIEVKTQKNRYTDLFNENGLELFNYINESFEGAITVKYTIMLHFLRYKNYIKGTNTRYLEFVRFNCDLGKIKFSRLDDIQINDEKYLKQESFLTDLLKDFKHLNGIE